MVARRAGIDPGYLDYLERRADTAPSTATLGRLAAVLDTTVVALRGGVGRRRLPSTSMFSFSQQSEDEEDRMQALSSGIAVDEIDRRECQELLATERVGRLAVIVEGRPEIFPVNYSLDIAGAVVFETAAGTKLAAALNRPVVFEVDHTTGAASGSGWSVVVHGVAHRTNPASLCFAGRRPRSWLSDRPYTVRVHPSRITGRRLAGGSHEW